MGFVGHSKTELITIPKKQDKEKQVGKSKALNGYESIRDKVDEAQQSIVKGVPSNEKKQRVSTGLYFFF
jgi:hypothetical protein